MVPTPCLFYKVSLNPDTKEPLLGTMQAYNNQKIFNPCIEALLPPTQMSYENQCFPKDGLRWFYRTTSDGPRTYIKPNSLFSQQGKPSNMCGILEYVIKS